MKKIGFVLLVASFAFIIAFGGSLNAYLDIPSLAFVLGIVIALLISTGNAGNFIKSFKVLSGYAFTNQELHHCISAVELSIKGFVLSGAVGFVFGVVSMLHMLSDMSMIGPALATAMLTMFYAAILSIFLLIINYQLKFIQNSNVSEE